MRIFTRKKIEAQAKHPSKKLLKYTAGAAIIGASSIFTYKAIKKRINEEDFGYLDFLEKEDYKVKDQESTLREEKTTENKDSELEAKVKEFNSKRISYENCEDATPEEMQHYLNAVEDDKKNADINSKEFKSDKYDKYDM